MPTRWHLLVGTLTLSSLAMAFAPMHGAAPIAPPARENVRFEDTRHASQLLSAFDEATMRRDVRAIRSLDGQFSAFLQEELREARTTRGARVTLNRLNRIDDELQHLQGRINPRSISARRELYVELVRLADKRGGGRRF